MRKHIKDTQELWYLKLLVDIFKQLRQRLPDNVENEIVETLKNRSVIVETLKTKSEIVETLKNKSLFSVNNTLQPTKDISVI